MNDNKMNDINLSFEEKFVNEFETIENIIDKLDDIIEFKDDILSTLSDLEYIKELYIEELEIKQFQTEEVLNYIDEINDIMEELEEEVLY